LFLIWFIVFLSGIARSPFRFLSLRLPAAAPFIFAKEMNLFNSQPKANKYAVQGILRPHFLQREIEDFRQT
jgi:hypothetical protein